MSDKEILKRAYNDFIKLKAVLESYKESIIWCEKYDNDNLTYFDFMYDYIRHIASCNITNVELNKNLDRYVDFDYGDMNLSIWEYEDKSCELLDKSISIYDNEGNYIGDYSLEEMKSEVE